MPRDFKTGPAGSTTPWEGRILTGEGAWDRKNRRRRLSQRLAGRYSLCQVSHRGAEECDVNHSDRFRRRERSRRSGLYPEHGAYRRQHHRLFLPGKLCSAYFNTNREGIILARMVWDQLIDRDPETFQYKPALATAWRWVDDLTLEFDLRQGVKRVGPKGDIKPGGHGVLTPGARLCVRPPAPWHDPQVGDTVACDR